MNSKMENAPFVELGDLIEICDNRNIDKKYGINDVCGMTIEKEIIPTKADIKDTDLSKFYIVQPQEFVYNPRTHGRKIGLGFNNSDKPILISWNNTAFKVKDMKRIVPTYLYMIFTREEWNREACFNSWGSSTVVFSWEDFCKIKIPLPSIKTQNEVVAVYHGLKKLAEENEKLLEPLSKSCEAFIADCKNKYEWQRLGDLIEIDEQINSENRDLVFLGLNRDKNFMPSVATTDGLDKSKYKVVSKGKFVFSGMQTGRDICIRFGLYNNIESGLVSPAYTTYSVIDKNILPEFIMLNFKRSEMDRLGWFLSDSSVRSNLDFDRFHDIKIPLPPKEVQQKIVDLYNCYEECKRIANEARAKINNLCPALVQKAAHSK